MKTIIIALLTSLGAICTASANSIYTIANLPPAVIKTYPVAGNNNVDPSVHEIRVTFSKDMMTDHQWSWVMLSNATFPKLDGDIKFINKRTCIAEVKLQPNKTYAIWFNTTQFHNFKDVQNHSAIPYLLVFHTKG